MRTKTVLRYYCDHCSKGLFRKPDMERHEQSCVHNPNRICWACQEFELDPAPLTELIKIASEIHPHNPDLSKLTKAAQGCPACIIAALVQERKASLEECAKEDRYWISFDYKGAMQEMYAEKNRAFRDAVFSPDAF